jgi:hypothetical protein
VDAERGEGRCGNCGAVLSGPFCAQCGQEARDLDLSLPRFVGELVGNVLRFDSRVWRTLAPLVFRPGEVTARYISGERARFVPPVRLYLFVSLVYFLALAWISPGQALFEVGADDPGGTPGSEAVAPGELARTPDGRFISPEGDTLSASELLRGLDDEGSGLPAVVAFLVPRLMEAQEDPAGFRRALVQGASYLMFFLVPFFAALLHGAWLGRAYYLHHLLFALHFHVFAFIVLGVRALLDLPGWTWLSAIGSLLLWVPALYLVVGLHRVHGGSIWLNAVRAGVVGFAYVVALGVGLAVVTLLVLL